MLRVAIAFVGLFLVGAVIGGVLAVVGRSPSGVPVAAASPTPSVLSPTGAPPPTATAVAPILPTATPTPEPQTSEPTETIITEPTAPPETPTPAPETPTPATPEVSDRAAIEAFVEDLGRAIARGGDRFLFDNLHPAVIDRYGEQQCRQYTSTARTAGLSLEYRSANGPEPWDWVLDDRTTTIPDAWTVSLIWREPGLEEARDVHIAPTDATWRWFTDCGDPLA